jgi:hypothetical protein
MREWWLQLRSGGESRVRAGSTAQAAVLMAGLSVSVPVQPCSSPLVES